MNLRIYLVLGVQGSMTCTTIKACKKWLAIMSGLKGVGSSWNMMAMMSLPICRLRCNCCESPGLYGSNEAT